MVELEENEEPENDQVVSISEFMEGMEAQQLEADLVLGGDEGKECTYEKGYMTRQAVFSCLSCAPTGNAGFCTACSLICHDGHEVVELWTRRAFRCDCGNQKFGDIECKLFKDKEPLNKANVYNQNYAGVYCTCHRPFPDPEAVDQGEMLQCCICEDWFHESHLGLSASQQVPRDDEGEPIFDELICPSCVDRCDFLSKYPGLLVPPIDPQDVEEDALNADDLVELPSSTTMVQDSNAPVLEASECVTNGGCAQPANLNNHAIIERRVEVQAEQKPESSVMGNANSTVGESSNGRLMLCRLKRSTSAGHEGSDVEKVVETYELETGKAVFLAKTWRAELCRCQDCLVVYAAKGVEFLLNREDTLQEYEETAKRKREEYQEKEEGTARDFMKKLGHVQKMEIVHGFNDMASELESFLTPFGQEGKTVTSNDIYDFFEKLQQKRRRKN